MKDIFIYGAGGMGKEVAWLIENINSQKKTWNILGYVVGDEFIDSAGEIVHGYPVLGGDEWLKNYKNPVYYTCAIGKSDVRKLIHEKFSQYENLQPAILVDPSVRIDKTVNIGEGTIICRNCTVTVDTNIGKGVLMNTGASVGHDSDIGDFCTLLTNSIVAGHSKVEESCEIGSGAFVLEGKTVVANTIIAPLSSVIKDIMEQGTYAGNPARRII